MIQVPSAIYENKLLQNRRDAVRAGFCLTFCVACTRIKLLICERLKL